MKKLMVILCAMVLVFGVVGVVNATLTTIGTATYGGSNYKLIYEDTQDLVWLDYRKDYGFWGPQDAWASGLGGSLTVNLYPGYTTSIDWSTGWRLPSTDESKANLSGGFGYQGPDQSGYHNYEWGYNMVNSEMGHLYYESLGNKGLYATDGTVPQPGYGLQNTGPFDNLLDLDYWSSQYSLNSENAWFFKSSVGAQREGGKDQNNYALAVRDGDVDSPPIPEPPTLINPGFEVDEPTGGGLPNSFGDWAGDYSEIVTARNGITPLEGIRMLEFLGTTSSGSGFGGSSGVCQLIDVSAYSSEILEGRVNVYVSAFYNRVLGSNQTDTLFYLWLAATTGVPSDFPHDNRLVEVIEPIITDGLVNTWEMESLNLWLPVNTSYLALQVIAAQNVSPQSYPEFDGHYADNVTLTFNIAPIPEPTTMLLLGSGLVGLAGFRGRLRRIIRIC